MRHARAGRLVPKRRSVGGMRLIRGRWPVNGFPFHDLRRRRHCLSNSRHLLLIAFDMRAGACLSRGGCCMRSKSAAEKFLRLTFASLLTATFAAFGPLTFSANGQDVLT